MLTKVLSAVIIILLCSAEEEHDHDHDHDHDHEDEKTQVATFANNGITGSVVVDHGAVTVTLDLTNVNSANLPDGFDTCTTNGLSWHIHTKWDHDTDADRIGSTDCGADKTGGHYDPWHGCGPASGNEYCESASANREFGCIPTDNYAVGIDFPEKPFSVEVGDWSGKYNKLNLTEKKLAATTFKNFYEVIPHDVENMSVVFHCNGGKRAFCAPFKEGAVTTMSVPYQSASELVDTHDSHDDHDHDHDHRRRMAEGHDSHDDHDHDEYNEIIAEVQIGPGTLRFYPNGDVKGTLDATSITVPSPAACSEYEITLWTKKSAISGVEEGDECKEHLEAQWDPTHQCLPWSNSEHCDMGILCNDTAGYMYECEPDTDRYSCAPGDISGKFEFNFKADKVLELNEASRESLIPPTYQMVGSGTEGLALGIHCSWMDSAEVKFLACADFVAGEEDDSGVQRVSFIMAIIISLVVLMA